MGISNGALPSCPGSTLDLKRSSFKKLGKFVAQLAAEGLFSCKEDK